MTFTLTNQAIFDAWNYTCSHTYCEWMVWEATHIHNWHFGSRKWIEVKAAPAPSIVSRCFTMFHVTMSECPSSRPANKEWTNCCSSSQRSSLVSWRIEFRFWYFLQMQSLPFAALECDTDNSSCFWSSGNGIDEQPCQSTGTLRNPQAVSKNLSQVPLDVIQYDPVAFPYAKDVLENIHQTWTFVLVSSGLCPLLELFTWTNVWIVRTPCSLRLAQILMHHYQILPAIFGADELHEWRNLSRQKICTMCPKIPKMVYSPTNKAIPLWN